jgi:hypothetical protein
MEVNERIRPYTEVDGLHTHQERGLSCRGSQRNLNVRGLSV